MTQSPDPDPLIDHQTFVRSVQLIHKVYHCDTSEEAVHVFREEVLGEDAILESVLGCLFAHATMVALLTRTDVCQMLDGLIQRGSAQWN